MKLTRALWSLALLLGSAAAAHAADTFAAPPAATSAAPLTGVYQTYKPVATPAPTPDPKLLGTRIAIHKDTFSLILDGGIASILGDEAKFHNGGFNGGAQFVYGATEDLGVSIYTQFNSVPYSITSASKALTSYGVGVRAVYQLLDAGGIKPFVEGGLGLYMVNRAISVDSGFVDSNNDPIYITQYKQDPGLGFNFGLGLVYSFTAKVGLRAAVDVTSLSLNGGTGDSLLMADPTLGLLYTF
jgi:opacity protein-like surface antigen